jgi:hypothetical protein
MDHLPLYAHALILCCLQIDICAADQHGSKEASRSWATHAIRCKPTPPPFRCCRVSDPEMSPQAALRRPGRCPGCRRRGRPRGRPVRRDSRVHHPASQERARAVPERAQGPRGAHTDQCGANARRAAPAGRAQASCTSSAAVLLPMRFPQSHKVLLKRVADGAALAGTRRGDQEGGAGRTEPGSGTCSACVSVRRSGN